MNLSCCSGSWMCCCVTGWAFTAAWRRSVGSPWSRISGRDCGTSQHTSKNTWNLLKDLSAGKTHWTVMTPCNFCITGGKLSESPSSLPRTAGWSLNGVRRLTCDDGWRCWVLFSWWVTWLVHTITAQWFWNKNDPVFTLVCSSCWQSWIRFIWSSCCGCLRSIIWCFCGSSSLWTWAEWPCERSTTSWMIRKYNLELFQFKWADSLTVVSVGCYLLRWHPSFSSFVKVGLKRKLR